MTVADDPIVLRRRRPFHDLATNVTTAVDMVLFGDTGFSFRPGPQPGLPNSSLALVDPGQH